MIRNTNEAVLDLLSIYGDITTIRRSDDLGGSYLSGVTFCYRVFRATAQERHGGNDTLPKIPAKLVEDHMDDVMGIRQQEESYVALSDTATSSAQEGESPKAILTRIVSDPALRTHLDRMTQYQTEQYRKNANFVYSKEPVLKEYWDELEKITDPNEFEEIRNGIVDLYMVFRKYYQMETLQSLGRR